MDRLERMIEDHLELVLIVAILALLIVPILGISLVYNLREEYVLITVVDKARGSANSGSDYLVWTERPKPFTGDPEVFKVDDAPWYGHWRASDVYGQIEIGHQYLARVIGYRWPFLSQYRNIIEVTEWEQ